MKTTAQNIIVTGSSRGIGRAIACKVANEGDHVLINYLQNSEAAEYTAALLKEKGVHSTILQGNVRDEGSLKEMAAVFDRVDLLVHNAAIGVMKDFDKIRSKQWDLTLESSLRPFWLLSKHVRMAEGGQIIGISSMGSRRYIEGYAAMGAAKAGMEALTRQLSVELGPRRIRVNTICGGLIQTDTLQYLKNSQEMIATVSELTPLGRIGSPEDIANVAWLLCQKEAHWINGQVIIADGGLSAR